MKAIALAIALSIATISSASAGYEVNPTDGFPKNYFTLQIFFGE